METKWSTVEKTLCIGSQSFTERGPGLKLTGRKEVFDRHIKEWELVRMEQIIRNAAEEITEDYRVWKKINPK